MEVRVQIEGIERLNQSSRRVREAVAKEIEVGLYPGLTHLEVIANSRVTEARASKIV